MKSEVIKYIKNNKYIEELFLDFVNDFKEQYKMLNKNEKKEFLKVKDEIFRNWLYSSIINETYITPNYLINSIVQERFPGNYIVLPVIYYKIKGGELDVSIKYQYYSEEDHPIFNDIDVIINNSNPSLIFQYENEQLLDKDNKIIDIVSIQSQYYINYLIQLCEELNLIKEIRAINCKCFQRGENIAEYEKLSKKEKLNNIIEATIKISIKNINSIGNIEKQVSYNEIVKFLDNNIKEENFNEFINELIPFANNFIENIDQFTEDKKILETIKFAQVLMGENVGCFVMGTEIRVYFDIYFTTIFSYYLGILSPTYLGTFLINEIVYGIKESESFFEKVANIFNDELGHDLTKLGEVLVSPYNCRIKENINSKIPLGNIENIIKNARLEKKEVISRYNKCKELYGNEDNIIHKFMTIINDNEERRYSFAESHINKFAQYLIKKKGLKEKTVNIYSKNIELFICDFLDYKNEEELLKIDSKIVDRYLGEWFISRAATGINSIKEQIYSLSHYFNFLYIEGLISNEQREKIKETMKNKDKYIIKYMKYLG